MSQELITKQELIDLANEIHNIKFGNHSDDAILWAIKYHLPLVLMRIEAPIDFVNAVLIACFTSHEKGLCNLLTPERCMEIGSPLLTMSPSWNKKEKIDCYEETDTP